MIPVIICGGVGTKMWPMSRAKMPKHFLPLIGDKSLFQVTFEQLRKKFAAEDIYVSTNAWQAQIAKAQEPEMVEANFILEPEMRNQGPATALIAAFLVKNGRGQEPFMLVQPDDLREPAEKFFEMMDVCEELAKTTGKYITGGIRPDYAIMGIDYLVKGTEVASKNGVRVYEVEKFIWRGSKEDAEAVVKDGKALTHSNHTCMTPENFMKMVEKYKPEWYEPLVAYIKGADLVAEYAKMPKGPVEDMTQKAHEAGESLVVELPFKWVDIGTWESLVNYQSSITNYELNGVEIGAKNNFVKSKKFTALVGVDDLVVVETDDALLICKRDQSGRVGEVVEKLKAEGKTELL